MKTEHFHRMPENICRAYEVAQVANFEFKLVDLSENKYFKGIFEPESYLTEITEPAFSVLHFIQDKSPDFSYVFSKGRETHTMVKSRIDKNRIGFKQPFHTLAENIQKDSSALAMFKKAVKTLSPSFIDISNCLYLSEAVAKIDGVDSIKSHHLAEAINYCFIKE